MRFLLLLTFFALASCDQGEETPKYIGIGPGITPIDKSGLMIQGPEDELPIAEVVTDPSTYTLRSGVFEVDEDGIILSGVYYD